MTAPPGIVDVMSDIDKAFRDRVRKALSLYLATYGYIDIDTSYGFDDLADDLAGFDANPDDPRHAYVDSTYQYEMGIPGRQGTQFVEKHRCAECGYQQRDERRHLP